MTPLPLGELRLNWGSHFSALWWLGLLYRRPARFHEALKALDRWPARAAGLRLYLHAAGWVLLASVLGRLLLYGALGLPTRVPGATAAEVLALQGASIAYGIAGGIGLGILFGSGYGIAVGIAVGITVGIAGGMALGIAGGIGIGIAYGVASGIAFGIAVGVAVGIADEIIAGITGGIASGTGDGIVGGIVVGILGGITVGIAGGILLGIAVAVAWGIGLFRTYYLVLHLPMVWPRPRAAWYWLHPVAWDDVCLAPFPGLYRLLVAYAEAHPAAGEAEIRRLIDEYPSQRGSALRAQTILRVRESAQVARLSDLPAIVALFPEVEWGYLGQTHHLREMVAEIARLQTRLDTLPRPFFREPVARALVGEVRGFEAQVAGLYEPLASEFRAAAANWLKIAEGQLKEAQAVLAKRRAPTVFGTDRPVDPTQEAFVERGEVAGELERQIMLGSGCPGILLYGRRRMGKTTLLVNLPTFLPDSVRLARISLQEPKAFESLASLVGRVAQECHGVLAGADAGLAAPVDLAGLFDWLAGVDEALARRSERLVLALDEYEQIDAKIGEGVFTLDLLATLRESMQRHRRVTWVLAGSHHVADLGHAPWPSFLVSVCTVEVPPLAPEETRLLLTDPLRYSPLWKRDDPRRPRFDPGFWGPGGIERIHAEADGWPRLVQLIAETAVDLVNDSALAGVDGALMDRALDRAVVRGDNVLRLLVQSESTLRGEWEYLVGFRRSETQAPPIEEALCTSLCRRLLVADEGGQWRLRVPLMQRWLRKR